MRAVIGLPDCVTTSPRNTVKLASVEGTFNQLWIKARFEEAVERDLSCQDSAGKFSSSQLRCLTSVSLNLQCY